ncbi:exported hypothetical protein [Capnocytophaga canimorsus]|nr:hypothetical protein [Capnocytophaga canimorsus]CEN50580.1 exported hypothetical protein [Capnocytophaga canimorsus]
MKKMYVMLFYIFSLLMVSCSKDDSGGGNTSASHLSGTIHWQFAGKVGKYKFSDGNYDKSVFLIGSSSTKKGF